MARTMLENEDGYDFEDIMMDVFRNLGYKNVRNPSQSGDMGRDIIMEKENENGEEITYIAECKHFTDTKVGRPIIQKLDSACRTFETENKKQGMVITTNKFSRQAEEYAEPVDVELMDGDDIRDLADDAGLDIYNGNVEIISDKAIPFATKRQKLIEDVHEEFQKVRNFQEDFIKEHRVHLELIPFIQLRSEIYSTYKSDSVGVVNKIKGSKTVYKRADDIKKYQDYIKKVYKESDKHITIDEDELEEKFYELEFKRFGFSEGEFKEEHKQEFARNNKEEISYTARNNATYNKIHKPRPEDVDVTDFEPVYVPKLKVETEVKEYSYTIEYFTNEHDRVKVENEILEDVEEKEKAWRPALCPYCGSVNKKRKLKTERLEEKPICKHCSVKDRYALRKRYFKDESNHQEFNDIYNEMNKLQKASENSAGVIMLLLSIILIAATIQINLVSSVIPLIA